jgi:hypothetical protein
MSCGQIRWVPLVRITSYVSYMSYVFVSYGKTIGGHLVYPDNCWTCLIFWVIQRSGRTRSPGDCQTRLEALGSDHIGV